MLKKLLFGAGAAYLARKFMGGSRRSMASGNSRSGLGMGGSRWGRRSTGW